MKKFLVIIRDVVLVWGSGILFVAIAPQITMRFKILIPLSIIPYVIAFAIVSLSSEGRRSRHLALVAFLVWSIPIGKWFGFLQEVVFRLEPNISGGINPSSMYFVRFLFLGLTMTAGYGLSLILLSLKTKKNLISIKVDTLAKKKSGLIAGGIALVLFFASPLQILINKHTSKPETYRGKIALSTGEDLIEVSASTPSGHASGFTNSLGMAFVRIEPGMFMMGSPANEKGRDKDERQHEVTLTKEYYLQTTEVTQGQWQAVMGTNPSRFKRCGENCPVERVSWEDVQAFVKQLNRRKSTYQYRLPTEAEWEYAARAGSSSRFSFGDSEATLNRYAWFEDNSGGKTNPVSQNQSNDWGLYDMRGNVWEWCQDRYGDYPFGSVTDPQGPSSGDLRVLRGGGWYNGPGICRSASRAYNHPAYRVEYYGFRLAASLAPAQK